MAPTPRRRAGTVRFGDLEVSVQTTVLAAGAIVWLGIVVANTGGSGVAATWTNASFPALLLVATGLVRSIRTRLTVRLFLLGGLMLSIALVGAWGFERVVSDPGATSRDVVVPLMEETLKLAPVLYLLAVAAAPGAGARCERRARHGGRRRRGVRAGGGRVHP